MIWLKDIESILAGSRKKEEIDIIGA